MKRCIPLACASGLLMLIIILTSGCISMAQDAIQNGSISPVSDLDLGSGGAVPENSVPFSSLPVSSLPGPATSVSDNQPLVSSGNPILPEDPYANLTPNGTRILSSSQWQIPWPQSQYTNTFVLRYNATGLRVNVTKGPLYVEFEPNPLYDCMPSKDSCREVNPPFFQITVHDAKTGKLLAEDGYGRTFETNLSAVMNRFIVYREGPMDLTLYGNNVNVRLNIATGAAPKTPVAAPTQSSLPQEQIPEEMFG